MTSALEVDRGTNSFFTTKRACPLEILRMFIYWQEGTLLTEFVFAGVSDLFHNMLSDITLNVYRLGLRFWLVFEKFSVLKIFGDAYIRKNLCCTRTN